MTVGQGSDLPGVPDGAVAVVTTPKANMTAAITLRTIATDLGSVRLSSLVLSTAGLDALSCALRETAASQLAMIASNPSSGCDVDRTKLSNSTLATDRVRSSSRLLRRRRPLPWSIPITSATHCHI